MSLLFLFFFFFSAVDAQCIIGINAFKDDSKGMFCESCAHSDIHKHHRKRNLLQIGLSYYGRECYYVNTNILTHSDAKAYCENLDAELAVIHSSGVNSHIQSLISGISTSTAHIGYNDRDSEGTWEWYNDDSVVYTNWNTNEPNGDYTKNCAGIYKSNGRWDDYVCSVERASVCRTVAQYTSTTTGCVCSWDSTRYDCACCLNGGTHCGVNYPHECAASSSYCGTKDNEPKEEWTVVFKVPRYSNVQTADLWQGSSTYNPDVTLAPVLSSTSYPYKASAANNYDTNSIKEVKYAFYTSGKEVGSMTFDTTSTNSDSWFDRGKLLYATWTDILTASSNYFSIYGASKQRTFFASRAYGGCTIDSGWMVTSDVGNSYGCDWDRWYSKPYFIYSTASTGQAWHGGSRSFAENVAILFKYYDTDDSDEILCDSGWDLLDNSCYKSSGDTTATFAQALAACKALRSDADLTSVLDDNENDNVMAMMRRYHESASHWIGANDITSKGNWTWTDGSQWSYDNWHTGEPNGGEGESCAAMRWSVDGSWNDAACSTTLPYICKYNLFQVSCADWKRKGWTSDGYYTIDPDGPYNGVDPTRVYCDMSSESTGITRLNHNQETRQYVNGYEGGLSHVREIWYDNGLEAVKTLADISGECYQYIKYDCLGSTMASWAYTAWYNRDGTKMTYWGGASAGSGRCGCGESGTCTNGQVCNCNVNDGTWRADEGFINEKSDLPVTQIRNGDTGDGSEAGYNQLWPMYCKSEESFLITSRSDFYMTKDRGLNSAYDQETVNVASAEACADTCVNRVSYFCRSFKFQPSSGNCYLSADNHKTQPSGEIDFAGYYMFTRILTRNVDPNDDPTNNCLENWAEYNGNCYYAGRTPKTWNDAELWCQQNGGGHLAVPETGDEHEFLQLIMRWSCPDADEVWIGVNDIEQEGNWTDTELNEIVYARWRVGEPNGGDIENGVIMYTIGYEDWIDVKVNEEYAFACKAAVGAQLIAAPSTHSLCRSGWDFNGHSCYHYGTSALTWANAEAQCESMSATLVVIEDDREFNYLKNYHRYRYPEELFWIGLSDSEEEGVWKWISGQTTYPFDGAYWSQGSPDNSTAGAEHCSQLNGTHFYDDVSCDSTIKYICEDDTVPNSWPTNLRLTAISSKEVLAEWDDPLDIAVQNNEITGYKIKYWSPAQLLPGVWDVPDSSLYTTVVPDLAPGTTYEFGILAYNDNGDGLHNDALLSATTNTALLREATRRIGVFEVKPRSRLANHVQYIITTATLTQCTNTCLSDAICMSVNYQYRSNTVDKMCEINSNTHTNNPGDLEQKDTFQYVFFQGE
ncbi:C-type mannose receptor 2-like [Amphiura filiformis]|uniref:C-type mannose receptor 2-like n=1 Tax=Amphiura filiformis TaxID=82378 RepID=UPI003B21FBCA